MPNRLHIALLSGVSLLNRYLDGETPGAGDVRRLAFLEARQRDALLPDYHYKNARDVAFPGEGGRLGDMLHQAIAALSRYHLRLRGRRVVVNEKAMASWQNLLTFLPPLPFIAFLLGDEARRMARNHEAPRLLRSVLTRSALPTMDCPVLDDVLAEGGLVELHMHLNGTTEFDAVWQDFLRRPRAAAQAFRDALDGGIQDVAEQVEQLGLPFTGSRLLYKALRLAGWLRESMADFLRLGCEPAASSRWGAGSPGVLSLSRLRNHARIHRLHSEDLVRRSLRRHPAAKLAAQELGAGAAGMTEIELEGWFLWEACRRVREHPALAWYYHLYLLLMAAFNRLLVQQVDQVGFDQFQKIADNKLRDPVEREYARRFRQVSGPDGRGVAHLEGRFAPKKTPADNIRLMQTIVNGLKRLELSRDAGPSPMTLRLVAHFIKEPEDKGGARGRRLPPTGSHRHSRLRIKNRDRADALLEALRRRPELRGYFVGVDAAANELDAPPEVYAPVFRRFERQGYCRRTYHAGEDFEHLLSGLRAMWEAVHFLDLQAGDRIGHGTAAGVDPSLWIRRVEHVHLHQEEWLDNLVFAYSLLREEPRWSHECTRLRDEIRKLFRKVYRNGRNQSRDMDLLVDAWKLRWMDPFLATVRCRERLSYMNAGAKREFALIQEQEKEHPEAVGLFREYHGKQVRERGRDIVKAEAGFFSPDVYTLLQARVVSLLNERRVAIETMPTSNLRISFYRRYREHHVFRWLGLCNDDFPLPSVCVCSDDPGIFATSLRNEYAHIYRKLREFKLSTEEAREVLAQLGRNSRAFRFTLD